MRVLVTGASGFLGRHLVLALQNHGAEVLSLCRKHDDFYMAAPGTLVVGDVRDRDLVARLVSQYEVDVVVHLAAQTQVSVGVESPALMFRENVDGVLSVLEAARARKRPPKVIVASTDKVYGSESIPYTESTRLAERTPYGASKICVDVIAQTYLETYKMPIAITRCGNLYGPGHLNFSTLIPGTIRRFLRGEKAVVKFGGFATRDFLYIGDAVQAYMTLILKDVYGPFNFSGGQEVKIIDVVETIAGLLGKGREDIEKTPGNPNEIVNQKLDCTHAKEWLGWEPKTSLYEGLKETCSWYSDHFKTA